MFKNLLKSWDGKVKDFLMDWRAQSIELLSKREIV